MNIKSIVYTVLPKGVIEASTTANRGYDLDKSANFYGFEVVIDENNRRLIPNRKNHIFETIIYDLRINPEFSKRDMTPEEILLHQHLGLLERAKTLPDWDGITRKILLTTRIDIKE